MKTIKLIGMCMLAAVLGMSVQSCSKDDYQSRIKELIINENNYKFDSDGGSYEKEYRGEDLSCFKVSSNADWCTATIDFAKSTMTVIVDENETFDPRTATVTISDIVDGVSKRSFTVSQGQCDAIQTGKNSYKVKTDGGTVSIKLLTNVSYKVAVIYDEVAKDWITVRSQTRGLVEKTVELDVAKNTSQKDRNAAVRIYDEKSGVEDRVLITQEFTDYMDIDPIEYEIDERGGIVSVNVKSNADWDCFVEPEDTWVKKQTVKTVSDEIKTQSFTISPFTEKKTKRVTIVSFSNYFNKEVDVTITQTHYLYFEDSSVELMKGESKTLTPVNEKKWGLTWSSSDESVATVDENGKVTGVAGGGAVITVTSEDGNHTDQIAISVQEPKDLKDNLVGSNEPGYESVDGVKVMTSLDCTITNNSDNTIQLDEVSLYCDGEYKKSKALNRTLNKEGGSYTYTFPIDIEYEEIPDNPEEGGKPSEGESTEEKSNDESSNGSRAGTRDDSETKKKPKENTHKYQVVWDYTYGGEKFKFYYPESTETKKASTRRASTRRR
jgi:uncharacterized protein YjdB